MNYRGIYLDNIIVWGINEIKRARGGKGKKE